MGHESDRPPGKSGNSTQDPPSGQPEQVATADPRWTARRSQRAHVRIPILVHGTRENEPFQERTYTEVVNAHGALILLATPVISRQELLIIHLKSFEKLHCHVNHLGPMENGKMRIGIEFKQPSPRFWRIFFPPEDWNPSDRKLPQPHRR